MVDKGNEEQGVTEDPSDLSFLAVHLMTHLNLHFTNWRLAHLLLDRTRFGRRSQTYLLKMQLCLLAKFAMNSLHCFLFLETCIRLVITVTGWHLYVVKYVGPLF